MITIPLSQRPPETMRWWEKGSIVTDAENNENMAYQHSADR